VGGEDSSQAVRLVSGEDRTAAAASDAAAVPEQTVKAAEGAPATAGNSLDDAADPIPDAADRVLDAAAEVLAAALRVESGAADERARQQARRLTARWRQSIVQLIERERARHHRDQLAPSPLPWLVPGGKRQERSLATHWATAWWGDPLVAAVLKAAARHFQEGVGSTWREYHLNVPEI